MMRRALLALLVSCGSAVRLQPGISPITHPVARAWRACCRLQESGAEGAESLPAPTTMKLKEVKAELDAREVAWRGVCFERAELERALIAAREAGPAGKAPAAEQSPPDAETSAPVAEGAEAPPPVGSTGAAEAKAFDAAYSAAYERALGLKVKELRAELASRGTGWADLFEKEELAARLASLCARAALFSASGALEPGKAGKLSAAQLRQELADPRTPMLLDIYATWCGPCKMLAPELEKLASRLGESVRVAKLDSDAEPQLSTELRVQGLPTLLFYRPGAGGLVECHRVEGMPGGADALEALVQKHLR